jgi:hypothetical protein
MKMTDDSRHSKVEASRCAFDAMMWTLVLLLMLGFGGFVILSLVVSARGIPLPAVGAAVAMAVFCVLLLAMLLLAYFALSLARCCSFATLRDDDPEHQGKIHSMDME